jgi:hypothetical protein
MQIAYRNLQPSRPPSVWVRSWGSLPKGIPARWEFLPPAVTVLNVKRFMAFSQEVTSTSVNAMAVKIHTASLSHSSYAFRRQKLFNLARDDDFSYLYCWLVTACFKRVKQLSHYQFHNSDPAAEALLAIMFRCTPSNRGYKHRHWKQRALWRSERMKPGRVAAGYWSHNSLCPSPIRHLFDDAPRC